MSIAWAKRTRVLALLAIPILLPSCERTGSTASPGAGGETAAERFAENRIYRHHDGFLSRDDPPVVPAASAAFLADDDEVVGVAWNGRARAYDVRMLCYHHVINDTVGGAPIAITY